jgi:uncharacterized membrane protein YheB (UPF0754 family)
LKALYASKAFWPLVTTRGFLGATAIGERGKSKERKLTKKQMELQRLVQEATMEATKQQVIESKANTEKYIKEFAKIQEQEAKRAREDALMQAFMESQNRQMEATMSAIQGISMGPSRPGVGTFGVMRSSI